MFINTIAYMGAFIIAFASFGILAGAFASTPFALIFGATIGNIAAVIVGAIVSHCCAKAALETI